MPVVPSYGGDEEYSLQERTQSYQPRQGGWPAYAPPGLRPIGGDVSAATCSVQTPLGTEPVRWPGTTTF